MKEALTKYEWLALAVGPVDLVPMKRDGNSQIFCAKTKGGKKYLLKEYPQYETDQRPRLETEFKAVNVLHDFGFDCVPQGLHADMNSRWGLYSWLDGRHIQTMDIHQDLVNQVMSFYASLQTLKSETLAYDFPLASEACFSFEQYQVNLDYRFARLQVINDEALQIFLNQTLLPWWKDLQFSLRQDGKLPPWWNRAIPGDEWILSPSDVGFHNVLLQDSGELNFIDFEYFGWDDPAKMLCDLLLHPDLPIPQDLWGDSKKKFMRLFPENASCFQRLQWVFPVVMTKWCLILLNAYLPERGKSEHQRTLQLKKTREYFETYSKDALTFGP